MSHYDQHIQTLKQRYALALEHFQLDAVVLHSGANSYYAHDDHTHPFHPFALTQQWLPFDVGPGYWVVVRKDGFLELHWPAKQDFWHVVPEQPHGEWSANWEITSNTDNSFLNALSKNSVILSDSSQSFTANDSIQVNHPSLMAWLNYDRAVKTQWEVEQLTIANQKAVVGHLATQKSFLNGNSEFDIYADYLKATRRQQMEEPYGSIIALNENAAVLHYENKSQIAPETNRTLLIDAGYKQNGYASDITRTFTSDAGIFNELLSQMNQMQQSIVNACTDGTHYLKVHELTLQKTAEILRAFNICSLSPEEQLAKRIPQVFFPHGIGHLLGLNVHDSGGHQINRSGETTSPPEHAPFLRLMRPLEDGHVITIEPGLYFIPMLLDQMVQQQPNHGCDLQLIETLKPFGGIRIEDNVLVKGDTPINLTRHAFDELSQAKI